MPDAMRRAKRGAMPESCPEQSTHERTDGLTNVLPPKRRISPSTDAHACGLIHLDIQASCKGCDWTQTGPKAATQFQSHCTNTGHVTTCTSVPSLTTAAGGDL